MDIFFLKGRLLPSFYKPVLYEAACLVVLCITLGSCVPYQADLSEESELLHDYSKAPMTSESIGPGEKVDIDTAASEFVDSHRDPSAGNTLLDKALRHDKPVELSLPDLRDIVLKNNLDIEVVQFEPQIAGEQLRQEEAKFDSIFVTDASYYDADLATGNSNLFSVKSDSDAINGSNGVFTELAQQREQILAELGIDAPLITGGTAKVRQGIELDDKDGAGLTSDEDRAALKFSLSQPLLRGAGIDINTASIRIAKLNEGIAQTKTKLAMIRILANAEKAYWKLYAADKVNKIINEQLGLASDNLTFVLQMIEAGDVAPIERFSAELAVAQQLKALVVAETDVLLRSRDLSRILNREDLPLSKPMEFVVESEPRLVKFRFDRNSLVDRAMKDRLELLELELALTADQERIDLADNAALPMLALDFEYGLSDRQDSLGTAYGNVFGFEDDAYFFGIRFGRPITNEAARARLRSETLKRQKRLASRELRKLAVRQEVFDAIDVIERNWRSILAARQNVVAATANYQAEEQMLKEGERAALNVLIALQQLGNARIQEVKSIAEYQSSQIDLAYATGTLLDYAQIGRR